MPVDVIAIARHKKAKIEGQIANLRSQLEQLDSFIQTAEALTHGDDDGLFSPASAPSEDEDARVLEVGTADKPAVRKDSWAGLAVQIIKRRGGMPFAELIDEIIVMGKSKGISPKKLTTVVNSALWRRRLDIFKKDDDGSVSLRPKPEDIELTE